MDNLQYKNRQDVIDWLASSQMDYELVEHEAVPTVAEMLEKVKFSQPTLLAKNLFLRNKKKDDSFFLVVAQHDTAVNNDVLAKHFGIGKGNLRNGDPEQMLELLGVKPGSVNLFSIMNDTEDKVKLVLDKKVIEAAGLGVHPMDNTATVRVG
jgi:Ala-tRNA(Pro) deacylase